MSAIEASAYRSGGKVPYFIENATDYLRLEENIQNLHTLSTDSSPREYNPVFLSINQHPNLEINFSGVGPPSRVIKMFLKQYPGCLLRKDIYQYQHEQRARSYWVSIMVELDRLEYQLAEHLLKFFRDVAVNRKKTGGGKNPYVAIAVLIWPLLIGSDHLENIDPDDPQAMQKSMEQQRKMTHMNEVFAFLLEDVDGIFEDANGQRTS